MHKVREREREKSVGAGRAVVETVNREAPRKKRKTLAGMEHRKRCRTPRHKANKPGTMNH